MFTPVKISANSETVYETGFDMLEAEARDMTVPLSVIGSRLVEDVGAQFGTEGGWSGIPWVELSEPYREWKEKHAPGTPKLVGLKPVGEVGTREHPIRPKTYERSGRMMAELLDLAAVRVSPTRMVYAPTSDIAGFHQSGTENMPPRPPVELPESELHEWDRTYVRWLNGLIAQASLTGGEE